MRLPLHGALLGALLACEGAPVNAVDSAAVDAPGVDSAAPDTAVAADSTAPDVAVQDTTVADTAEAAVRDSAPAADAVGAPGRYFPPGSPWTRDVSSAPVDAESSGVIAALAAAGGWGTGTFRVEFSLDVLDGDATTPLQAFTRTEDFFSPDCDNVPMPVPPGGNLEGETGYACLSDGDCHLIVLHAPTRRLYEMWRADLRGTTFRGGCLAVWDLSRVYPDNGRGDPCTSADAAGFPIAPLLATADEVGAGQVPHALRFVLPNDRIRRRVYVRPATHSTGATSGPATAIPYGARLRLRADYPLARLPNDGARAVARALQRYGMLLSDGGNIALTVQSDRHSRRRWEGTLGTRDLSMLQVTDFAMVEAGRRYTFNTDCVRAP
ncbi:MAG: hypothetical protein HY909_10020 [Deltaproteobacteria bacterium]|nr:hypothetical protein [Deltaproteobacteria bacterium]